jgi:hypothetical protein
MAVSGVDYGLLVGQITTPLQILSTLLAGTLILFILYVGLQFLVYGGTHS